MNVQVEVEEGGAVVQSIDCQADPEETVEEFASRLANQIGGDVEDVLDGLGTNAILFQRHQKVGECLEHGSRWRQHRICVDLHFETESEIHHFSPNARWARVHQWGCRKFEVPHDACANLELHEGTPEGPALNERMAIGTFTGCRTVWLVKPGPEPNGGYR